MLIFLVTMAAIAVMLFVEWQHSIMSRRVRVMTESRPQQLPAARTRRG